jgi:hypothetical protein
MARGGISQRVSGDAKIRLRCGASPIEGTNPSAGTSDWEHAIESRTMARVAEAHLEDHLKILD